MLEGWALCEHRVEFHTDRSSPSQVFYKINVLKEFAKFTGTQPRWGRVVGQGHLRRFPLSCAKFLRTFLQNSDYFLVLKLANVCL